MCFYARMAKLFWQILGWCMQPQALQTNASTAWAQETQHTGMLWLCGVCAWLPAGLARFDMAVCQSACDSQNSALQLLAPVKPLLCSFVLDLWCATGRLSLLPKLLRVST